MVYLLETDLTENKHLYIALAHVYGIGNSQAMYFCKKLGLASDLKVKELSQSQKIKLERFIENSPLNINSDLKKFNSSAFKKLLNIKSYKGLRKYRGLPVRGQRTHTNAKTSKKLKFF
jgi:small subunit ribosomal protein S13